jgi:hypothetical protein
VFCSKLRTQRQGRQQELLIMTEKIYRPVCFGNKAIASKPYAKCRACPHFPCYICQRCGRDTRPMTLRERGDFKVVCLWCFGKLEKWDRCRARSIGGTATGGT